MPCGSVFGCFCVEIHGNPYIFSSLYPCVAHYPLFFSSSWVYLSLYALLIRRHTSIEIAKYLLLIVHVLIAPETVWLSFFILINFATMC